MIRYILLFIAAAIILFILWDGLRRKKQRVYQSLFDEEDAEKKDKVFQEAVLGLETDTLETQVKLPELIVDKEEEPLVAEIEVEPVKLQQFISIYIMARQGKKMGGYDFLQTILSHDFHYGDKQLFHYYEDNNRTGRRLFSLASAEEPGDFDLSKIGTFACNGLILYMKISDHNDPKAIFDIMLDKAKELAEDFKCDLKLANGEPFGEKIEQSIQDQLAKQSVYS